MYKTIYLLKQNGISTRSSKTTTYFIGQKKKKKILINADLKVNIVLIKLDGLGILFNNSNFLIFQWINVKFM